MRRSCARASTATARPHHVRARRSGRVSCVRRTAAQVAARAPPSDRRAARRREAATPTRDGTVVLAELPIDMAPGDRAVLSAGDIFGEGSALSRYPIATDIVALADVRCLLIRTPLLRAWFEAKEPKAVQAVLRRALSSTHAARPPRRVPALKGLNQAMLDDYRRGRARELRPGDASWRRAAPPMRCISCAPAT